MKRRIIGLAVALLATGLLGVGLWPFAFRPPNRAGWLQGRPGLAFQPNGIAFDAAPSDWSAGVAPNDPAAFSIELWLEPGRTAADDVFHVLTLDDGRLPSGTVLCQWQTSLLLRVRDPSARRGFREAGDTNALGNLAPRFVAVTTDPAGTAFYKDGSLAARFPGFVVPASHLRGRLILADAAAGKHGWTGNLFGLAVFNRVLDAAEVARHGALWTNGQAAGLETEPGLEALYLFDEGRGNLANDRSDNRHRLSLPEYYRAPLKQVLRPPWGPASIETFDPVDAAMNFLGFVPFGYLVCAYRRRVKPGGVRAVAWAVAAGAGVSLLIEIFQVWLPDRSSSATDLFCNTLGTLLGAILACRDRSAGVRRAAAPPGW